MLQKRDEQPGAAGVGKPDILMEAAAEEVPRLLHSLVHLYTTELSTLAALWKSEMGFPCIRSYTLAQTSACSESHPAGHCPLYSYSRV